MSVVVWTWYCFVWVSGFSCLLVVVFLVVLVSVCLFFCCRSGARVDGSFLFGDCCVIKRGAKFGSLSFVLCCFVLGISWLCLVVFFLWLYVYVCCVCLTFFFVFSLIDYVLLFFLFLLSCIVLYVFLSVVSFFFVIYVFFPPFFIYCSLFCRFAVL